MTDLVDRINKRFGAGSVFRLGDTEIVKCDVVPSGSAGLDDALTVGGFPRGRIVEIYGSPSSGKTTLCLHALANAQKLGLGAALVDAEHALDPTYAAALGVDVDTLLVAQPTSGENALNIVEELVESGEVGIIVVDSVAALTPQAEIDGDIGKIHVGGQARMMSQAMRKLTAQVHHANVCLIFINQTRDKIGGYGGKTTPGGHALKFYASVRVSVFTQSVIKIGEARVGARTGASVVKNKLGRPFLQASFDLLYGRGISGASETLDQAIEAGVIEQAGSWFRMGDTSLAQGRLRTIELLESDAALLAKIKKAIQA